MEEEKSGGAHQHTWWGAGGQREREKESRHMGEREKERVQARRGERVREREKERERAQACGRESLRDSTLAPPFMFFPPPGPALCKLGLARSAVCSVCSA